VAKSVEVILQLLLQSSMIPEDRVVCVVFSIGLSAALWAGSVRLELSHCGSH
jgi:hypothetical protein